MPSSVLRAQALTGNAFAPFGDVIESRSGPAIDVNQGTCARFDDLAHVDVSRGGGRPGISIFCAQARSLPFAVQMLERHPLGSQAFVPMSDQVFAVVVAPAGDPPQPSAVRAFLSRPHQGVNFAPGIWHHPLIALSPGSEFLVVDRIGPGDNCEQHTLSTPLTLELPQ